MNLVLYKIQKRKYGYIEEMTTYPNRSRKFHNYSRHYNGSNLSYIQGQELVFIKTIDM